MKPYYMNQSTITRFVSSLKRRVDYAGNDEDAMLEAIECLENAKPGYLLNLIPQNHPDRVRAAEIISEWIEEDDR